MLIENVNATFCLKNDYFDCIKYFNRVVSICSQLFLCRPAYRAPAPRPATTNAIATPTIHQLFGAAGGAGGKVLQILAKSNAIVKPVFALH